MLHRVLLDKNQIMLREDTNLWVPMGLIECMDLIESVGLIVIFLLVEIEICPIFVTLVILDGRKLQRHIQNKKNILEIELLD